ncbi:MAG: HNH endonuclease [Rickettsia endosymbiont of Platyusa sonomae]|nr:HNH endonuclease [Rickettsia endosymbiont of Platyusa sonomae]
MYESHPDPYRIGYQYDAHHIIQIDHGGPNTWWNIHPAHGIIEHKLIHAKDSIAGEIFKPKKK